MNEQTELKAVLDEDLATLLRSIQNASGVHWLECGLCQAKLTEANVQFILPLGHNQFRLICDQPICVETFVDEYGGV